MIRYCTDTRPTATQFVDVLQRSTLGERRPIADQERMEGMVRHGDLWCTAWDGSELIGVARSLTDWSYVCYLSDLAIDQNYQHQGIGLELLRLTQQALHPQARIVLLAAPLAEAYYPKIGMDRHNSAWTTLALPLLSKRGDRQ